MASCEAAADVAALLVALALDPQAAPAHEDVAADAARSSTPPEPEGATGSPQTVAPRAEPSARPDPQSDATRPAAAPSTASSTSPLRASAPVELTYAVGAALVLDVGMLPQTPAWGLRPWLEISIDRLRAATGFTLWLAGAAEASDYREAMLEGRGIAFDVSLGLELARARLSLVPSAVAELAELTVSTAGISDPGAGRATWLAAGLGLHGGYRVGSQLQVTLDTSALAPLRQARWLVRTEQGDVAVFAASAVTFRFSAGVAYVFP